MQQDLEFDALQEIGELSLDGVMIYDLREKRTVYVNDAALQLIGVNETEIPGSLESLLDLVIPEDREYLKHCVLKLSEQLSLSNIEFRMKRTTEDVVHVACNAYLITNRTNLVIGMRDISKIRQHESYLVEFGAKKNTLLDTLTHQISGALALMRNLMGEAEKSANVMDRKSMAKYFSLINENNRHCVEIINNLLRDEHFQSPNIFVKYSRADVVEIVNFIFEELSQSYKRRKFTLTCSDPTILVVTDEVKLLQIVNNLTSNALKFSPAESVISIEVTENADNVLVAVRDQGIGIPENLKPLVFERHSGASRTGLNGEKPMGIGLSICRNLAELMGAKIWFESTEGIGTTFFLSLPKNKI